MTRKWPGDIGLTYRYSWVKSPLFKNHSKLTKKHSFLSEEAKKHVNRDSHIASSPISQSSFFEKVGCLILASSQRKLHGYIEILKFNTTIKKIKKFKLV